MKHLISLFRAVATVAVVFMIAACRDSAPGIVGEPEKPSEDQVSVDGLTPEQWYLVYVVMPARDNAFSEALDEIRRTFTIDDMRAHRWKERWPELWGPEGTDVAGHWEPPHPPGPEEFRGDPERRREHEERFQRFLEENRKDNPHFDRHLSERRR